MGLDPGDKERARGLDPETCYERIASWLRSNGDARFPPERRTGTYYERFGRLVKALPPASDASRADRDFVFAAVISSSFEQCYHSSDSLGVKMAAYAFQGLEASGTDLSSAQANAKHSSLWAVG